MQLDLSAEVKATMAKAETSIMVFEEVQAGMVREELDRRKAVLAAAFKKLVDLRGQVARLRPDSVQYNADGSKATELWSKKGLDDRSKLSAMVKQLEDAIDKVAGENPDYMKLQKVIDAKPPTEPASE